MECGVVTGWESGAVSCSLPSLFSALPTNLCSSTMTCSLGLFAGTTFGRLHTLISVNPSGIFEGTFCRTGPGTELLLSMQGQRPILTALMCSGRGSALRANCLLRALERAPALARPGMASSTHLLPLTVGCGSCWEKPQSTLRFGDFCYQPWWWRMPPGLMHGNEESSQALSPWTCLGRLSSS